MGRFSNMSREDKIANIVKQIKYIRCCFDNLIQDADEGDLRLSSADIEFCWNHQFNKQSACSS